MNEVKLIGNIGGIVYNNEGDEANAILVLSVATSYKYTDKAGLEVQKTQWHKVTMFRKSACIMRKSCKVGDRVFISGRLDYNDYEDKEGNKRREAGVVVDIIYKIEKV